MKQHWNRLSERLEARDGSRKSVVVCERSAPFQCDYAVKIVTTEFLPAYCKKLTDVGEKSSMCRAFTKPSADNRHHSSAIISEGRIKRTSVKQDDIADPGFVPRIKGLCRTIDGKALWKSVRETRAMVSFAKSILPHSCD